MLTPAQRHKQAALAAKSQPEQPSSSNVQLMMRLIEHKRLLKETQSIQSKIEKKREFLNDYSGFLDALPSKTEALSTDDSLVLSELYIWAVDCFDLDRVLPLIQYMNEHGIKTPERHLRDLATFTAEELAEQMRARTSSGYTYIADQYAQLSTLHTILSVADMPDKVWADFNKQLGLVSAAQSQYERAIEQLNIASALNPNAGVKNELKRLEKLIQEQNTAPSEPQAT